MLRRIKAWLRAVGIEIHGNYCGPGYGRLDRELNPVDPPVDALDRLCLDHDVCYAVEGPTAFCDVVLLINLRKARQRNAFSGVVWIKAWLVGAVFWLDPAVREQMHLLRRRASMD